jgi:predicted Fe-Mo cluster-binding NifX family protein
MLKHGEGLKRGPNAETCPPLADRATRRIGIAANERPFMRIAVTLWKQRVAPVFDIAREILLVDMAAGQRVREQNKPLTGELPAQKALCLVELGVDTLICGAVSRPILAMLTGYGIRVVPYVAGPPEDVIRAWCRGTLEREMFGMPGCRRRGRHAVHGHNTSKEEETGMNGKNQDRQTGGGRGQGGGGRGRGGRGQGGGRRPQPAAGPPGTQAAECCVCLKCGQRTSHERGVPCYTQKCPQCGGAMARE